MRSRLLLIILTAISLANSSVLPTDPETNSLFSTDLDAEETPFQNEDTAAPAESRPGNVPWISLSQDTPIPPSNDQPQPAFQDTFLPSPDTFLSSKLPCTTTNQNNRFRARDIDSACDAQTSTDIETPVTATKKKKVSACMVSDFLKHLCCRGPPGLRVKQWFGTMWKQVDNCDIGKLFLSFSFSISLFLRDSPRPDFPPPPTFYVGWGGTRKVGSENDPERD